MVIVPPDNRQEIPEASSDGGQLSFQPGQGVGKVHQDSPFIPGIDADAALPTDRSQQGEGEFFTRIAGIGAQIFLVAHDPILVFGMVGPLKR